MTILEHLWCQKYKSGDYLELPFSIIIGPTTMTSECILSFFIIISYSVLF